MRGKGGEREGKGKREGRGEWQKREWHGREKGWEDRAWEWSSRKKGDVTKRKEEGGNDRR